jgi:hypothetical protein
MRRLRPGERIRLEPGGPLYVVDRVSPCAAYIHRVYDPPREVEITARDGTVRRMKVARGPVEPGISTCAFVYRDAA